MAGRQAGTSYLPRCDMGVSASGRGRHGSRRTPRGDASLQCSWIIPLKSDLSHCEVLDWVSRRLRGLHGRIVGVCKRTVRDEIFVFEMAA
jgi:hypothetical protein